MKIALRILTFLTMIVINSYNLINLKVTAPLLSLLKWFCYVFSNIQQKVLQKSKPHPNIFVQFQDNIVSGTRWGTRSLSNWTESIIFLSSKIIVQEQDGVPGHFQTEQSRSSFWVLRLVFRSEMGYPVTFKLNRVVHLSES